MGGFHERGLAPLHWPEVSHWPDLTAREAGKYCQLCAQEEKESI